MNQSAWPLLGWMTETSPKSVQAVLHGAKLALQNISDTARLDAEVFLARLLKVDKAWLYAHPEAHLTPAVLSKFQQGLTQLSLGTPLPYVLGSWEFFGLHFSVNSAVLIPRPETELLVEHALSWVRKQHKAIKMVDIGTGSGIIPITILANTKNVSAVAVDISLEAVAVARENCARHKLETRMEVLEGDLLSQLTGSYDLITANLPYIPSQDLNELSVAQHEPRLALDGGPDGLDLIRRLLSQSTSHLLPGGLILLEIDMLQGESVAALGKSHFPTATIEVVQDLSGRDRLVAIALAKGY